MEQIAARTYRISLWRWGVRFDVNAELKNSKKGIAMVKSKLQYIVYPSRILYGLAGKGILPMSDRKYLEKMFERRLGYKLNLDEPRTFNEKTQWLKLNDRKSLYIDFTDKYEVKKHIKSILGEEYIIPTLGVWEKVDEIKFEKLPNKFVLKCTHDSGGIIIVSDKEKLDAKKIKKRLSKLLKRNYFYHGREYPYLKIKARIIAEPYMADSNKELNDYKVFVFAGKAKYIQVDYDRFSDHHRNFYNVDWEYLPFTTCYPTNPQHIIERPECLEQLLLSAEKVALSLEKPAFLRVDFYIVDGRLFFGEVTFYHGSGMERFEPCEYEFKLGEDIKI